MTFSLRQLAAAAIVAMVGLVLGIIFRDAAIQIFVVGLAGGIAALFSGAGQSPRGIQELPDAIAKASRGDMPALPMGAGPEVTRAYESISQIAERVRAERAETDATAEAFELVGQALRDAADGRKPSIPSDAPADARRLLDDIDRMASAIAAARELNTTRRASIKPVIETFDEAPSRLREAIGRRGQLATDTAVLVKQLTTSIREIGQNVEVLNTSAEESSSSILHMTNTHDDVAESVGELASSVRESASSIEEMAYSIKEVAKNVDALSLTAEETSSSMNEMDISIDQVQSNANETARLSEEVAQDAEKGAEAILKTIGEIYRIKESTQEAVAVISNLGSRIEAIGQILNVIDDVAEQTNLLALNAAIIAAQAGEHGKGFAVVADEIKDLAERAGASTKEIAELTRTIQNESKNAIAAVERGAKNVDRGVEVSNDAERALKKILESSQKSTNMVRAIARATVEQAKGSKQVTDAIGRIAETVQQIAAATGQQARGSELIMKSVEKMRAITQNVERSSQEQARGSRQVTQSIESISSMLAQLNQAHRTLVRSSEELLNYSNRIEGTIKEEESAVRQLTQAVQRLHEAVDN